jgi:hypothetical protein
MQMLLTQLQAGSPQGEFWEQAPVQFASEMHWATFASFLM